MRAQETRTFDNKENSLVSAFVSSPVAAAKLGTDLEHRTPSPGGSLTDTPLTWDEQDTVTGNISPREALKTPSPAHGARSPLSARPVNGGGGDGATSEHSPAMSKSFAGSTPGVKRGSGSPASSVNDATFGNLNDIEILGDDATPVVVASRQPLREEDSFVTETSLVLDTVNNATEMDDTRIEATTPSSAARDNDALRRAVSAALTPRVAVARAPNTPANTPAALVAAAPQDAPSAERTSAASSPLEEDVVEEVRSWFASVHSKLDVALCAISPAGVPRASGAAAGVTPRQLASSRFAPTPNRATAALTPGAYTPGGAPVTPAALRSLESPETIMGPGGAVEKLIGDGDLSVEETPSTPTSKCGWGCRIALGVDAASTPGETGLGAAAATPPTSVADVHADDSAGGDERSTSGRKGQRSVDGDVSLDLSVSHHALSASSDTDADAAEKRRVKVGVMAPTALRATCLFTCAALLSGDVIACIAAVLAASAGWLGFAVAAPASITCVIHASYFIYPPALAATVRAAQAFFFGAGETAATSSAVGVAEMGEVSISAEGLILLASMIFAVMLSVAAMFVLAPDHFSFDAMDAVDAVDAVDASFISDLDVSMFADEDVDDDDPSLSSPGLSPAAAAVAASAAAAVGAGTPMSPDPRPALLTVDHPIAATLIDSFEQGRSPGSAGAAGRLDIAVDDGTPRDNAPERDSPEAPSSTKVDSIKRLIFGAAGEVADEAPTLPSPMKPTKATRICHPPAARAMGAEVW